MVERARRRPPPPFEPARRPVESVQSRQARPASRRTDQRRLLAAALSSVAPGIGQLINGRRRAAVIFGLPSLLIVILAWLTLQSDRPTMLLARVIAPSVLTALLVLNLVVFGWRAVAAIHAFASGPYPSRAGRLGAVGLVVILVLTAVPHAIAWSYGTAAQAMFAQVFSTPSRPSTSAVPPPTDQERTNVLLIGIDAAPGRTEALTDTLIVVSLDPVGRTVSMVSVPRDLASVPLGDGNLYGPKINSLASWADRHPSQFPDGGTRTLETAVGALLGIPIHYYASVDLPGFVAMVDAVGGVDIQVTRPLSDPKYGAWFGVDRAWSIEPGLHHLDGANALAYARIRKSPGENDFTRAARQQDVLVALRDRVADAGVLMSLPRLMSAVGGSVRTDLPADRLPELAALVEEIGGSSTTKLVLGSPMIKSGGSTQYGSVFLPVPSRIAAMSKVVFGPPGIRPTWPLPKGSPAPSASAAP